MAIAQKRTAKTASMASPIGGWNARDSLAEMNPMDAVQLVNFFPTPSDIMLRKGYTKKSVGINGSVESLMNYAGTTSQTLFAAAGTIIYDTTATATAKVTGLSNARFQHVNISTAGGDFLVACNGEDAVQVYNGTYWFSIATTDVAQTISTITKGGTGNLTATVTTSSAHGLVTGNQVTISGVSPTEYNGTYKITRIDATSFSYVMASEPATDATVVGVYDPLGISGVDNTTFINVNLFKNRLWFTQKDTMKIWYLDVNTIAGSANQIDFGGIARNGGYLQAMGTWTLDAGQGADDYAVFITNMGEVMVYNGTDPTTAETWALKGVWQLGQTFARRCFFKWSGDLLLLTQDGLVPLSAALQSSRLDPRVNLTDKIFYAVSQAANAYSTNFGWQINFFASQNMLILNIPTTGGSEQYVMHTITKAWAKFTNINALCWEVHNDKIYFGSVNYVGYFWDTFSDNGANINGTVQQAFSYFESRGQLKRFTMVRPILITSNGVPTILCGVNIDFDVQDITGSVTFNPATVKTGLWDVAIWDSALFGWGAGQAVNKVWQGVNGIGYSAGVYMSIASQNIDVRWASTDYVMEAGGVI
jgi:hypothetical protein